MKIAVIGSSGLVGKALFDRLREMHNIVPVGRGNYILHVGETFDVVINADGNSHKYWANENPREDFDASVYSVMNSLFDFKYKKYIFVSSIDAEEPRGHYGFNKRIAEDLVKQYADNWQIVRLCSVIGQKMKKGPVYDILHNNPIYLTSGSTLQLISVGAVAHIVNGLLLLTDSQVHKLYTKNISVREIAQVLGNNLHISPEAIEEHYTQYTYFAGLKTSERYLEEIL